MPCHRCRKELIKESQSKLCGTCRSDWAQLCKCEKCGCSCWHNRWREPKEPYMHEGKFLCKGCWNERLIPIDSICPHCLKTCRSWNKSLGVCRSCAKNVPRPAQCACGKVPARLNDWRWNGKTFVCLQCFSGRLKHKRIRHVSRSEYRRDKRIKSLPKDMKCPVCKTVTLNIRAWVIKDERLACRSCWYAGKSAPIKITRTRPALPELPVIDNLNPDGSPVILPEGAAKCMACGSLYVKDLGCICGNT